MWRLVLMVSLLCCSSEGSVTCKDENNGEVDWYILYKTPRNKSKGLTGLDYIYIYPDAQGRATSGNNSNGNNKKIDSPDGVLANTLQPLFNPPQDFGFISYSDQPPGYMEESVSSSYGHSKGVVMVEKNRRGVWLLHSTPQFPCGGDPDYFWPESGAENAQIFICVTFNYSQFKHIGEHLQLIRAYAFSHDIPSDFHETLQEVTSNDTKIHSASKKRRFNPTFHKLTSSGRKDFYSIAKQRSADGEPEVGDLYYSIAVNEKVDSDVKVQTWGRQPGHKDPPGRSFCPTNGKKVENIESVKTDLGEWKPGNDHSKWCVAVDQNKPWTCIADVNRSKSQYNRRGGALCVKDAEITYIFKSFVQGVEEC